MVFSFFLKWLKKISSKTRLMAASKLAIKSMDKLCSVPFDLIRMAMMFRSMRTKNTNMTGVSINAILFCFSRKLPMIKNPGIGPKLYVTMRGKFRNMFSIRSVP